MDKYFVCLNFFFNEYNLIKNPIITNDLEEISNAIVSSDVHLGFLIKKSLCGKKAYLNTLGSEGEKILSVFYEQKKMN